MPVRMPHTRVHKSVAYLDIVHHSLRRASAGELAAASVALALGKCAVSGALWQRR
jgi:hypothetical protein